MRACLLPFAACLVALVGCKAEDDIYKETITYEDREPIALRVAIMKREQDVWFFRLSGPKEQVKERQDEFDAFVKSVRFEGSKAPKWTEPKGWKKDPPGGIRVAGYRLNAKPKELEVTVNKFPADSYSLMDNMHRWQRQINVPLAEKVADLEKFVKHGKIGEQEVAWVRMDGLGVHSVSKPADPMAANQKEILPGFPMNRSGGVPFKYTAPKGWAKQPPRKLAMDVYVVGDGDKIAEVTLTPLGGDPVANINRWREQVGLEELSKKEDIAKTVKEIKVAGIPSYYVDVANPDGPPGKNRILGVIVPQRRTSWFIKMTGPLDLVGQHKVAFETFVESFKK